MFGGALALAEVVKQIIGEHRPPLSLQLAAADTSPSYPSGHTTTAAIIAVTLIVIAATVAGRTTAIVLGVPYVLAVAASRIYLGDHYLPDVFGAMLCARRAVRDMSITVAPGEVHGLIGPNGAGKTTLIDAITGFVRARPGSIRLDEVSLDRMGPRRRAAHGVARSFQSGELFNDLTVRENLAVGSDDAALWRYATDLVRPGKVRLSSAAVAAAHEFGLDGLMELMPEELPFGRRRLIGIARAVASEPSILLLDEPASGLDTGEAHELAALIRVMADRWGIGILLVEHNLDLVLGLCDRVTVMASGEELLEASAPEIVRTHPAVIAAYVGDTDDEPAAVGQLG